MVARNISYGSNMQFAFLSQIQYFADSTLVKNSKVCNNTYTISYISDKAIRLFFVKKAVKKRRVFPLLVGMRMVIYLFLVSLLRPNRAYVSDRGVGSVIHVRGD